MVVVVAVALAETSNWKMFEDMQKTVAYEGTEESLAEEEVGPLVLEDI